jgi:hypothetical protein
MGRRVVVLLGLFATPVIAGPSDQAQPERLLDAPVFTRAPRMLFAYGAGGANVEVAWAPITGATRYHVTWIDHAGQPIDSETTNTTFARHVAPGHYQMTVTAIDTAGIEGALAQAIAIDVITVRARPPGNDLPAPPTRDAFAIGTWFSSPDVRCALGNESPVTEVRAVLSGAPTLHCASEALSFDVPLVIAPVVVAAQPPPLPRGETSIVHVTVASVAAVGDRLDVVAIGDIRLGEAQRVDGGLDVPVRVLPDAWTGGLSIQSEGLELGRVELPLSAALVVPPPPAPIAGWWALELGGQVGALMLPSEGLQAAAVGHPAEARDSVTSGPLFGPRVGLFPIRRVGLEAEAGLVTGGYAERTGVSSLLVGKLQIAVRAVEDGPYGLRLLVGTGVLTALREHATSHRGTAGEVHAGAAFTIETRRDLWLRLQVLDVITPAQDAGYAHCFELQLGVVTRLGRRDRWK